MTEAEIEVRRPASGQGRTEPGTAGLDLPAEQARPASSALAPSPHSSPPRAPGGAEPVVDAELLAAVERLRLQVAGLSLTLDLPGAAAARQERDSLLSQLDDHLLPRLRRPDAPVLAVIGGSTGAGKSTLTNSLVRRTVSRSGVLRPTTRSPVLVHHPADSGAFLSQRILPRLTRVTSEAPEPVQPVDPNAPRITGLRLVPHDGLEPGMAIIDAPDIDSLVHTNRDLAVQVLQAADLWVFVTTAVRYADATPWELLRQAAERGAAVAVVLDRVPPESLAELRVDLAIRLRERGLGAAALFAVPEAELLDGFLPDELVDPLRQWLARVAGDHRARDVVTARTRRGVLTSLPARVETLAAAGQEQAAGWRELHEDLAEVFASVRPRLLRTLADGSLLRGEVLARWQEFTADGAFARRLDAGPTTFAERLAGLAGGRRDDAQPLDVAVTDAVRATIRAAVRQARDDVLAAWRSRPHGAALLAAREARPPTTGPVTISGGEPVETVEAQVERAVRDWRVGVSARVGVAVEDASSGDGPRIDRESAADVLFVVAVDERSDPEVAGGASEPASGADPVSATDTVGAARRVLAGFLGTEAVRSVAADARADLLARAAILIDAERRRLERLLENASTTAGGAQALLAAERRVAEVR